MGCPFGGRVRPGVAGMNREERAGRVAPPGVDHLRATLAEHAQCCAKHIVVDRADVEAVLEQLDDTRDRYVALLRDERAAQRTIAELRLGSGRTT